MDDVWLIIGLLMGTYFVVAAIFLALGNWIAHREPTRTRSRLTITIHLLAFLGFLIGLAFVWMAYTNDHVMNVNRTFVAFLFPLVVYGFVALLELKAWVVRGVMGAIHAIVDRNAK